MATKVADVGAPEAAGDVAGDRPGGTTESMARLYDDDFFAWTQAQDAVLRTHFAEDHRLDVEHLAEEVEDLGKSELHAVESFIEQVIADLLKLDYSGHDQPRSHWRAEVLNFRRSIERKITPSIRRRVEGELDELFAHAREIAAVGAMAHEPDLIRRLPRSCPYDWHAIWQRDVLAEAGIQVDERGMRGRSKRSRGKA